MGQSVHPISFRIPYIRRWKTLDFPSSNQKNHLFNDLQLKTYLENVYFYNKYLIDDPLLVREGKTLKIFFNVFLRKVNLYSSLKKQRNKLKSKFLLQKKFNTIKSFLKRPLNSFDDSHLNKIIFILNKLTERLKNNLIILVKKNKNKSQFKQDITKILLTNSNFKLKVENYLISKNINIKDINSSPEFLNIVKFLVNLEVNKKFNLKQKKLNFSKIVLLKQVNYISKIKNYLKNILNFITKKNFLNNEYFKYFLLFKNNNNIIKYNIHHNFVSSFFKRKKKKFNKFNIHRFINLQYPRIFKTLMKNFKIKLKSQYIFQYHQFGLFLINLLNSKTSVNKLNILKKISILYPRLIKNNILWNLLQGSHSKKINIKSLSSILIKLKENIKKNFLFSLFNQSGNTKNYFSAEINLLIKNLKVENQIKLLNLKKLVSKLKNRKIRFKGLHKFKSLFYHLNKNKKYIFLLKRKQKIRANWLKKRPKKTRFIHKPQRFINKRKGSYFANPMFVSSLLKARKGFYKKYPFLNKKRTIFYKVHPKLYNKKRYIYKNLYLKSTNYLLNTFSGFKKKKIKVNKKLFLNNLQNKIRNNLKLLALSNVQLYVKHCDTFSGIPLTNATILSKLLAHLFKFHRRFYHRFLDRLFKIVKAFKIVSGLKIIFTGRTSSSARSKQFTFKYGRIPTQTLNAHIDYSFTKVLDKLGISGFKVWIFFNKN